MSDALIDSGKAAKILKCSVKHITRLMRSGKLKAEIIDEYWYTTRENIDEYFEEKKAHYRKHNPFCKQEIPKTQTEIFQDLFIQGKL